MTFLITEASLLGMSFKKNLIGPIFIRVASLLSRGEQIRTHMHLQYNVQCTLGCGTFFFKILIRRAFYSPRPGDIKTVCFFFLRLIFLEYSDFKVWDPL